MKIPGAAWTALILALTGALGGWLTEYVQHPFVPIVVMALSLIAKAVEIYFSNKETRVINESAFESRTTKEHSTLFRLLFG